MYCLLVIPIELRIEYLGTIWANAMTEFHIRMILDIDLNLLPIALIVAYSFAGGAYGQQAGQGFDLGQCSLKFSYQLLSPVFRLHSFADVGEDQNGTNL
jgi:hypothetical protein